MRFSKTSSLGARGLFAAFAVALAVVGCDSDNPTGPAQQQVAPPTGNQNSSNTTWNISVTTSADTVDLNAGAAVIQVEVTARRNDNNALPVPGTTARLSTTAGQLTSESGTNTEIPISFDEGGVARATLATGVLTNEGVIIVRAQIETSFGAAQIQVLDLAPAAFQITGVSPSTGPPSGGTPITITGSGFIAPLRVTMNVLGQTLLLDNPQVSSSGSSINARTPPINLPSGQNAVASITVENAFDATGNPTATDTLAGAFTYTRSSTGVTTLKLISLSPTFGPNEGGTQVSVIGEGFGSQVQVYFSNGPLVEAQILSVTPTRLEVMTPSATGPNASNANSLVSLRVVDPVSGQEDTLAGAFQYGRGGGGALFISAISPGEDEYLGGTLVTLFGQGFEEPVAVSMGGVGQQIISVTGTEVVVRTVPVAIGCADQTGATSLTNIETAEGVTGPSFTYVPVQPTIVGVSPSSGSAAGGQTIRIDGIRRAFGVGFDPPMLVTINGVPAGNVTVVDNDSISVVTPPFTGTFGTESCTTGAGTGTRQVPETVDIRVENVNTGCNDTLANAFIYQPTNGDCVVPVNADFSFALAGGGNPLQVQFFDNSTGNVNSWSWDFGDGTSSSEQNPTHTFPLPNTWSVTLTVSDGTTTDNATQNVTVTSP